MQLMRILCSLLIIGLVGGCSLKRHGHSFNDDLEYARVEQTVGNHVSAGVLEKTLFCLNARRETRPAAPITNVVVSYVTNVALNYVTNQTVTVTSNQNRTMATNLVSLPPPPPVVTNSTETADVALVETNQPIGTINPPSATTNQSVSKASNVTLSKAPNQTSSTINLQTLLNSQITVTTNNVSITTADTQAISAETNVVVTTVTNTTITAVTNVTVQRTNVVVRDYYLYAELTPPPDFTLASGESLVLLVDGVRHGFTTTNTMAKLASRRGFSTYVYKVPPQVLVDIANAKQVKVRLRGNNSLVERKMSYFARNSFRKFVMRYFTPDGSEEMQASNATAQPGS